MPDKLNTGIQRVGNSPEHAAAWNCYVDSSAFASFYHRFEWKSVTEREFGHETFYLASVTGGQIDGVFPLVLIRSRLFGRILCSLPFVNFCGPAANSESVTRELLAAACDIARDNRVDYFEIRSLQICDNDLPRSESKVSMTIPLVKDSDEIWNAFTSKHRNNIRRAYKTGIEVRSGGLDLLDDFYDLLSKSWRDHGTPVYRKRYFETIIRELGEHVTIFVAYKDGIPISTAFNGKNRGTVEGMWAGSPAEFRRLQSNYVLYWEMIKAACEEGYEQFHLGRSSVESGGESFKKKWCADTSQLYWQYFLPKPGPLPELNVGNPKFSLAISTWRKLPLAVTQWVGPLIARSIP